MENNSILLLHGALGHKAQLTPLAQVLELKGFTVSIFEFSGHGQTMRAKDFGINHFTDELKTHVRSIGWEGRWVFGYSMGGYVALCLAAQEPNIFGRIITLATKYDWNPEQAAREAAMLNPDLILQKVPAYADNLLSAHGERWRNLLIDTANMMQELGNQPVLNAQVLGQVKVPVKVMVGELDKMVRTEESEAMARAIPNGAIKVLSAVKHPLESLDVHHLVDEIIR